MIIHFCEAHKLVLFLCKDATKWYLSFFSSFFMFSLRNEISTTIFRFNSGPWETSSRSTSRASRSLLDRSSSRKTRGPGNVLYRRPLGIGLFHKRWQVGQRMTSAFAFLSGWAQKKKKIMINFLCQIKILLLKMLKLLKIPGFSSFFFQNFSNSRFFQVIFA